jgi:hypothetical protein
MLLPRVENITGSLNLGSKNTVPGAGLTGTAKLTIKKWIMGKRDQ